MRRLTVIRGVLTTSLLVLSLSACQMSLPNLGKGADPAPAAAENPITGGAVETTSLDAPATPSPPASDVAAKPTPSPAADAKAKEVSEPPKAEPAPDPAATTPPVPAKPRSPSQIACEKAKGVWTQAGSAVAAFCQKPTRDGGKSCKASTDCEGYCLARSGTCAPVSPMFGCQEILNENGRVLTQCLN